MSGSGSGFGTFELCSTTGFVELAQGTTIAVVRTEGCSRTGFRAVVVNLNLQTGLTDLVEESIIPSSKAKWLRKDLDPYLTL